MTTKQHVLRSVLFGIFAGSQAAVGYSFDRHDQTGAAVAFYLIALAAGVFALRAWGRRNYYP